MEIIFWGGVVVVLVLLLAATAPIASTKPWKILWGVVLIGVGALVIWPSIRPEEAQGWFLVSNGTDEAIVVQLEPPIRTRAYLIPPGQFGPFDYPVRTGTQIGIYTSSCELIGYSRVDGGFRGTFVRADRSFERLDLGDMGSTGHEPHDGCLVAPRTSSRSH